MVFLGLEKPVEYGAQQIFDPTMANMVLQTQKQYNDAARQEFYRGLQDIKDFQKEYGDFITPILADQDWYNKNVTGRVRDFINGAYERGIDLTRSPEGRAAITQLINSIPVGEVAKLRSSAKAAEEYLKNRGKLEAAGLYNPDLEERYLGYNLANWDTLGGGKIWDRVSPTEAKTLKEATEAWYNNRTPEMLTEADVKSFGLNYDPRYNYTGFADRHLLDIAAGETPGWRGSLYADYYRDLAERKVAAKGFPYTKDDVERQLQQDIATANREYKSIKRDADDFAKLDIQHRNAVALENLRHKNDMALQGLKNAGKGGSGSSTKEATSYGLTLLGRGIQSWAGSPDPGREGLRIAKRFASKNKDLDRKSRSDAFVDFYSMNNAETTSAWISRFGGDNSRAKDAATGGVQYVPLHDKYKLYTQDEMTSNTLYSNSKTLHKPKTIKPSGEGAIISMVPTGRVYTAPMSSGQYQQFIEVEVGEGADHNTYWYKVTETEKVKSQQKDKQNIIIAPDGYSTIPSAETMNQWTIMDSYLNKAAGLASEQTRSGQGILLDSLNDW